MMEMLWWQRLVVMVVLLLVQVVMQFAAEFRSEDVVDGKRQPERTGRPG